MGLTIHYSITAPANWAPATIRARLEAARQFAKTLPVVSVSELAEFRGKDCDFHPPVDGREDRDPFGWVKCQAARSIYSPWFPGASDSQSPRHMLVFSVYPAEGSEQMNVGVCSYPRHLWKASKEAAIPAWSLAFTDRAECKESAKVIRAFMRKWSLKKLADSKKGGFASDRFGGIDDMIYDTGITRASIHRGRYLSHRRGYAGRLGLVTIRDRMGHFEIYLKHTGTADEAAQAFANPDFQADLNRLVTGANHFTPPARGVWRSFCKTQFANDPRCGGWQNFVKAHVSVLALLEHMAGLGFKIEVDDEGHFWDTRDIETLAKNIGEYDALVAGFAGVLKDAAGAIGQTVESPIIGRPDFEHLEAKGQAKFSDLLKRFSASHKP